MTKADRNDLQSEPGGGGMAIIMTVLALFAIIR